jgi:hypothetical protein
MKTPDDRRDDPRMEAVIKASRELEEAIQNKLEELRRFMAEFSDKFMVRKGEIYPELVLTDKGWSPGFWEAELTEKEKMAAYEEAMAKFD